MVNKWDVLVCCFTQFSVPFFTVYATVPLTTFLIKVFFFDLSPHFGDTKKGTHAMRVSRRRGMLYNLMVVPTYGAIVGLRLMDGGSGYGSQSAYGAHFGAAF